VFLSSADGVTATRSAWRGRYGSAAEEALGDDRTGGGAALGDDRVGGGGAAFGDERTGGGGAALGDDRAGGGRREGGGAWRSRSATSAGNE
jgi:hypothetical protein